MVAWFRIDLEQIVDYCLTGWKVLLGITQSTLDQNVRPVFRVLDVETRLDTTPSQLVHQVGTLRLEHLSRLRVNGKGILDDLAFLYSLYDLVVVYSGLLLGGGFDMEEIVDHVGVSFLGQYGFWGDAYFSLGLRVYVEDTLENLALLYVLDDGIGTDFLLKFSDGVHSHQIILVDGTLLLSV